MLATLEAAMPRMVQVAFRFPAELVERIDKYVEHLRAEAPGVNINRTDAVRALVIRGLESFEAAPKKKR